MQKQKEYALRIFLYAFPFFISASVAQDKKVILASKVSIAR